MPAGLRDPLITPGIDAVQLEEKEYF